MVGSALPPKHSTSTWTWLGMMHPGDQVVANTVVVVQRAWYHFSDDASATQPLAMTRGEVILGSSLPFVALDARWQGAKSRCKFLDNVCRKTVTCAECHYLCRTDWIVVGYVTPRIPVLTPHRRNHCTARMHEASRIPADLWATHPAVLGMSGVRHSPLVCGADYKRFRSLNPRVWH